MASLVLDACVATKWVFPEVDSDRALRVLDRYRLGHDELIAPDIFVAEVANVAWKKCALLGEVTEDQAAGALRILVASCPELVSSELLIERALQLAWRYRRPVYDCIYVALALEEQCELVTADQHLVAAMQPSLSCVRPLSSF